MALNDHWRDYLHLEITTPSLALQVEQGLNAIWITPEGRQLIRQAAAIQQEAITVHQASGAVGATAMGPYLSVTPEMLTQLQYEDNGTLHQASVVHVLTHELFHMADPAMRDEGPAMVTLISQVAQELSPGLDDRTARAVLGSVLEDFYERVAGSRHSDLRVMNNTFRTLILVPQALERFNAEIATHPTVGQMRVQQEGQNPGGIQATNDQATNDFLDLPLRPIPRERLMELAAASGMFDIDGRQTAEERAVDYTDAFTEKYYPDDASRPQREEYANGTLATEEHAYHVPVLQTRDGQSFELPLGIALPRGITFGGDLPDGTRVAPAMSSAIDAVQVVKDASVLGR